MPVTNDIAASYRRPGAVMRGHLARGDSEPRALVFLLAGCLIAFLSQWPVITRQAHLEGVDREPLLAGALIGWMFWAPLLLYGLAGLVWLGMRVARIGVSGFAARLSLFWAFLAASPLLLLRGMTAGFVGDGVEVSIVGVIWVAVFGWIWGAGLRAARQVETAA